MASLRRVKDSEQNSAIRNVALVLLYVAFALYGTSIWWSSKQFNSYSRAKFVELIQGTADAPFVYRRLVPDLLSLTRSILPEGTRDKVLNHIPELNEFARSSLLIDTSYAVELGVFALLSFLSFLLFLFALRKLLLLNFLTEPLVADLAPCLLSLALPLFYLEGSHFPYDLPALGLFTAALAALQSRRFILYILFFTLAVWNKETAALLGVVSVATLYDQQPLKKTALFLTLQVAIFGALQGIVSLLWGTTSNAGHSIETHLEENLFALWKAEYLLKPSSLLVIGITSLLLFSRWSTKPVFLRQAFVIFPLLVVLYLYGGVWGEIRVFYEAFPILALLIFHSACQLAGTTCEARTQDHRSLFSSLISRWGYPKSLLVVATPLFLLVTTSWFWLHFASRFNQTSLKNYSALQNLGSIGKRWNASGHLKIQEGGVSIDIDPPIQGRFLEVTVDNNDTYIFSFFSKEGFIKRLTLKPTGKVTSGMELRRARLPKKARDIPLTSISVEAIGDHKMSLGHLRILPKFPSK